MRPRGNPQRDALKALRGRPGPALARHGAAPGGRTDLGRGGLPRGRRARPAPRASSRGRAKLGGVTVEIRTAAEILTADRAAEWAARRAQRDDPLLRAIWRGSSSSAGRSRWKTWPQHCRTLPRPIVRARAAALDAADLIGLDGDLVRLAYPFTAEPNDFEVILPGGRIAPRVLCDRRPGRGAHARQAGDGAIAMSPERRAAPLRGRSGRTVPAERRPAPWRGSSRVGGVATGSPASSERASTSSGRRKSSRRGAERRRTATARELVLAEAFELGRRMFGGLLVP